MAIFTRFSRLVRADLHAVLDNLELPDVQLRQAIREMEAAHDQQRRHCDELTQQIQRLQAAIMRVDTTLRELNQQLDWCFADTAQPTDPLRHDALIRTVLRRRLEAEQQRSQLTSRLAQANQQLQGATQVLQQQAQHLENLRQKAALFDVCLGNDQATDDACYNAITPNTISDADVDIALLRERQLRSQP